MTWKFEYNLWGMEQNVKGKVEQSKWEKVNISSTSVRESLLAESILHSARMESSGGTCKYRDGNYKDGKYRDGILLKIFSIFNSLFPDKSLGGTWKLSVFPTPIIL